MKIIQVINTMISNPEKISNVILNDNEYFFIYDKKFMWSIKQDNNNNYLLFIYPTNKMTIEELAYYNNWDNYKEFVLYKSEEIKTKEALESFSELYRIVSEKLFGLDDIFDEIIGDDV